MDTEKESAVFEPSFYLLIILSSFISLAKFKVYHKGCLEINIAADHSVTWCVIRLCNSTQLCLVY